MSMVNAFRSRSLIYRAIEDNEEDKAFIYLLCLDPQSLYQNNWTILHRPLSRKTCDSQHAAKQSSRLIDLLICLPPVVEDCGNVIGAELSLQKPLPIGFINLHGVSDDTRHHRTLDIGILISAEYQGKGYGSEAVRWILNWGFQVVGLHRVGLQSGSFNTGAIRLWKRLGFREDGRDRESLWLNGSWHDEVRFSMLETEWRALVEQEKNESDNVKL
jgi:GNAT superfamily N-acetyltransferase